MKNDRWTHGHCLCVYPLSDRPTSQSRANQINVIYQGQSISYLDRSQRERFCQQEPALTEINVNRAQRFLLLRSHTIHFLTYLLEERGASGSVHFSWIPRFKQAIFEWNSAFYCSNATQHWRQSSWFFEVHFVVQWKTLDYWKALFTTSAGKSPCFAFKTGLDVWILTHFMIILP